MILIEEEFEKVKQNCDNNIHLYTIKDYVLKDDAVLISKLYAKSFALWISTTRNKNNQTIDHLYREYEKTFSKK